jgi:hypothetical protein
VREVVHRGVEPSRGGGILAPHNGVSGGGETAGLDWASGAAERERGPGEHRGEILARVMLDRTAITILPTHRV